MSPMRRRPPVHIAPSAERISYSISSGVSRKVGVS